MVGLVRGVEAGLGTGVKEISAEEAEIRKAARRSLVSTVDIPEGAVIREGMVAPKRPGTGIPPRHLDGIIGRRARVAIPRHTLLTWDMFA
jgi:N-acetylneuraminate synthase/N,N'-diacetyllegionaminate synthase